MKSLSHTELMRTAVACQILGIDPGFEASLSPEHDALVKEGIRMHSRMSLLSEYNSATLTDILRERRSFQKKFYKLFGFSWPA